MKIRSATRDVRHDAIRNAKRLLRLALALSIAAAMLDAAAVTCSVSSAGLAFGGYDVFAAGATNGNATVNVVCTQDVTDRGADKIQPYVISLSTGSSLSFVQRTMKNGTADALGYNIYTSNAYSVVWGDGTGSTGTQSGTAVINNGHPTATGSFTAYGRIPALQDVAVGPYNDTITMTITW
jgi:spore coat protein U-like protein